MAQSIVAFTVIKWIGVTYLVYLAVRQWRTTTGDLGEQLSAGFSGGWLALLVRGFLVNVTNPKGLVFLLAVLHAQFVVRRPAVAAVPGDRVDHGGRRPGGDGRLHRHGGAAAALAADPRQQTVLNRTFSGLFATAAVVLSFVRRGAAA